LQVCGVVGSGSIRSWWRQGPRAEAQRAALIGRLDIRLVEDAPRKSDQV
jgi:hypothetical protein